MNAIGRLARLSALFLAAVLCVPPAAWAADLSVVATVLPLQVFTQAVAGGRAGVAVLVQGGQGGADVHEFTLRPSDIRMLSGADMVVINGLGLDEHMAAPAEQSRVVVASDGLGIAQGPGADPHVWLDPMMAASQVEAIGRALGRLDPAHAREYAQNAEGYAARLRALDGELARALSGLKGRHVITYHEAFGHFARRYGLRAMSLTGPHAEQPLPGRMREVYGLVQGGGVRAVFEEDGLSGGAMAQVAKDTGARLCTLSSLVRGEASGGFYEAAMRQNAATLLDCLGKGPGKE